MADHIFTTQWIALKNSSHFYDPSGSMSSKPVVGGVLWGNNLSTLLSMSETTSVSSVFIRECYILWFDKFLEAVKKNPVCKFGLSSTPGCGKTMANNLIFKMAASDPLLCQKPILYQFKTAFYLFKRDSVHVINRRAAQMIALNPKTFYVLDGPEVEPVHSECLMLFISSPRNTFKDWHYHQQIVPLYFPVWSLDELRECRTLCYLIISRDVVDRRYNKYGGIAHYVLWPKEEPPPIEAIVSDPKAHESIRSVGEPSLLFPTSHTVCSFTSPLMKSYTFRTLSSPHDTSANSFLISTLTRHLKSSSHW
jgi:hypothetical protein